MWAMSAFGFVHLCLGSFIPADGITGLNVLEAGGFWILCVTFWVLHLLPKIEGKGIGNKDG